MPRSASKSKRRKSSSSSSSSAAAGGVAGGAPRTDAAASSTSTLSLPTTSSSSSHSLNRVRVGGQLLGSLPGAVLPNNNSSNNNNIASWDTFEPIITPAVTFDPQKNPERYILLPHSRYISVLAYKTGIKVGTLATTARTYDRTISETTTAQDVIDRMDVNDDDDDATDDGDNALLETANTVEETLVLVGCRDGSIREFSLAELGRKKSSSSSSTDNTVDVGPYRVAGPCVRPRRVIRVLEKKDPIAHMTVPHLRAPQIRSDGIVVYIAARRLESTQQQQQQQQQRSNQDAVFSVEVLRVILPHFDGSSSTTTTDVRLPQTKDSMRSLDKFRCRISNSSNKKKKFANTLPFRMESVAKVLPGSDGGFRESSSNNCSVFVVLARANAITVYYDQLLHSSSEEAAAATTTFPPMSISMPSNNPLTVASISLNKADITCGHYRGNIRVMNNILTDIELYHIATKQYKARQQLNNNNNKSSSTTTNASSSLLLPPPQDPRKHMITSRVHWHALPVTSIVYDSMSYPMDPLLYSGGDESVLVTWQIAQGRDRPVHVHPRLALGGIVHLSSSDRCDDHPSGGILVYCEDNTLQLLESHNKGCLWKVEGLAACASNNANAAANNADSNAVCGSQLVIAGLTQAPGYIHWFDPARERLASSLEVIPFNRISKTELDERPLPKPSITGHVFSQNGDHLITIDESQTENTAVGALDKSAASSSSSAAATIRFWEWNDASSTATTTKGESSPPYYEVASMTYPHGPKNRISAVDMSKDGTYACTVSGSEKAFRVWHNNSNSYQNNNSKGGGTVKSSSSWACRYKVKIPSGFSNSSTKPNGLAFSDDNSLLVIAFGRTGTIWDTDGQRLLTTFDHSQGNADIESVRFLAPGRHRDLLLVRSKACVSLRSPYGPYGSSTSFRGWSWSVPVPANQNSNSNRRGDVVTAVEYLENRGCIAIAVYSPVEDQSRVVFVDANTGTAGGGAGNGSLGNRNGSGGPPGPVENIGGCISSLCAVGKPVPKSNWDDPSSSSSSSRGTGTGANTKSSVALYALTSTGDLILLTEDRSNSNNNNKQSQHAASHELFVPLGPRLEIPSNENQQQRRKRQRTGIPSVATSSSLSEEPRKLALDIFGFGTNNDSTLVLSSAELPSLSSNFVKTFVCRNLRKTNQ
eukprot:jgi/Psemu1/258382/estExt_Genewise1Plus.C_2810061